VRTIRATGTCSINLFTEVYAPSRIVRQHCNPILPRRKISFASRTFNRGNCSTSLANLTKSTHNIKSSLNFKLSSLWTKLKFAWSKSFAGGCEVHDSARNFTKWLGTRVFWSRNPRNVVEAEDAKGKGNYRPVAEAACAPYGTGVHFSFCERREKRVRFETEVTCIFLTPLMLNVALIFPSSRLKYLKEKLYFIVPFNIEI